MQYIQISNHFGIHLKIVCYLTIRSQFKKRDSDGENRKVIRIKEYFAQEIHLSQIIVSSSPSSLHFTK